MMLARSRGKPRFPRSCYYSIPLYARARAPHTSLNWFCVDNEEDFLDLRSSMLRNPEFQPLKGTSTPFPYIWERETTCQACYLRPEDLILDDEVCAYIHRLQLSISQKLVPISKGKIPYVNKISTALRGLF